MEAYFEPVSKYKDAGLPIPQRGTEHAAGYDFVVAQDTVIPSFPTELYPMLKEAKTFMDVAFNIAESGGIDIGENTYTLDEIAKLTKELKAKPTLVSTGMKCHLDPNTYLELSVRSSTPLKYWIIMGNSVGVIDADYCDNPDNEGEIFFQLINLSPFNIQLRKGEKIGQGIIKPYLTTKDDKAGGKRCGGFGSTTNN